MNKRIQFLVYSIIGALLLMIPAFYNGYPIVYSDTGTHIASGFEMFAPADRPITYGLFIRLFSFNGFSLWPVIFAQSFILSSLLLVFTELVIGDKKYLKFSLVSILFLSLGSGLGWASCMLIADVFTPIALLSGIVFLFGNHGKGVKILLALVFFISVAMHLSHLLIFSLLFLVVFIFRKWFLPGRFYKGGYVYVIILILLSASNEFVMRPQLDKSKYIVAMGKLCEEGIAKIYLDEYCGTKNYKLCRYKDSLPASACDFIWLPSSPFTKMGAWQDETRDEYKEIVNSTFTKPKYIWLHMQASFKYTCIQLCSFMTGCGNGRIMEGSTVLPRIKTYFNRELSSYISSRQNTDELSIVYY